SVRRDGRGVADVTALPEVRCDGFGDCDLGRPTRPDVEDEKAEPPVRVRYLAEGPFPIRKPFHSLALGLGLDPAHLSGTHRYEERIAGGLRGDGQDRFPVWREARS